MVGSVSGVERGSTVKFLLIHKDNDLVKNEIVRNLCRKSTKASKMLIKIGNIMINWGYEKMFDSQHHKGVGEEEKRGQLPTKISNKFSSSKCVLQT